MFDKIKNYYNKGIYKKVHIIALVQSSKLSTDEYEDIVGESFPEDVSIEKEPSAMETAIKEVQNQNKVLEAKIQALTESNQFLEECLVEMAEIVYA